MCKHQSRPMKETKIQFQKPRFVYGNLVIFNVYNFKTHFLISGHVETDICL